MNNITTKPYTGYNNKEKFFDYFDNLVGFAKDVTDFDVSFPYPERLVDEHGRTWELKDGTKPDNHQFTDLRGKFAKDVYINEVPYQEKYQESPVPWQTYIMSSTIAAYKQRGDLK